MTEKKLRISVACEAGVRYVDGKPVDYHAQCSGMEDRRVGRNFRCVCGCHKAVKSTVATLDRTAQVERQRTRDRGGRYSDMNKCQRCGASVGSNYFTDPRSNGDIGHVLCRKCAEIGGDMDWDSALAYYRNATHGGRRERAGRKPLDGGAKRYGFALAPKHLAILERYAAQHSLKGASKALRHLLESIGDQP